MNIRALLFVIIVVFQMLSACKGQQQLPIDAVDTMKIAEGIWQQSKEVAAEVPADQHLSNTTAFQYQDGCVTMYLLSISKFRYASDDSFYKLSAKWEGNVLYFRFPNGTWDALATFTNGHFEAYGDGKRREFERVTPEQVAEYSKGILKPDRALFDYSWLDK